MTQVDDWVIEGDEEWDYTTPRDINKPLEFAAQLAQGATFGFGDEISAAIVGGISHLTGGDYEVAYWTALEDIRKNREALKEEHPIAATGTEIVGGVGTGALAGGKILASETIRNAPAIARYGAMAGVGAVEGGLYGAGSSEDDRLGDAITGALIGAVAAPAGAKAFDMLAEGGGTFLSFAARKLADTPRRQAIRAVRHAAIAEGIDPDDAVRMMDELGPEATLADLGENFRLLARSANDQAGGFRNRSRDMLHTRQLGQQDRLMEAAEVAAGRRAGDFNEARATLIQARKDSARPLYTDAFELGIQRTELIDELLKRPAMASAFRKGKALAMNEGIDVEDHLLYGIHYARQALNDKIGALKRQGKNNEVRILTDLRNDLMEAVGRQNDTYVQATNMYASDSQLIEAMDAGLDLFKMSTDQIDEALAGMTPGERDLFRLGGVRAIQDQLDRTNQTADSTRRLLGTRLNQQRLERVFDQPEEFIRQALAESEFTRTRNVVTGGSPTSQNLAAAEDLRKAIQPELIHGLVTQDPVSAARGLLGIFSRYEVRPETVDRIAEVLLSQGTPRSQIRDLFAHPILSRELGDAYHQVVLPRVAASLVPAAAAVNN